MEEWDGRGFGNEGKKGESIDALKKRVSIVTVLRVLSGKDYVGNRSSNEWLAMPCPFHTDRKPSASVNVVLGRFNCHSCEVGGDIIDIVQQVRGFSTVREAKEWITTNV